MARLMSQIKGGYYAANPVAVAAVLDRLRPPSAGQCVILDPCAGGGHALLQFAQELRATAYGIELSEDRAAVVRESLPEGQSLAPADFLRCAISFRSFSFIWCNPLCGPPHNGFSVAQQVMWRPAGFLRNLQTQGYAGRHISVTVKESRPPRGRGDGPWFTGVPD
jgi:hypothetical protein